MIQSLEGLLANCKYAIKQTCKMQVGWSCGKIGPMKSARVFRSGCPLASALDILGDKWSLIILRGLFVGFERYGDFLKGPERIATNILASRLRDLESYELIKSVGDRKGQGKTFQLTRKGADLLPVLQKLALWGEMHIPNRWQPPKAFLRARPSDFYPDD